MPRRLTRRRLLGGLAAGSAALMAGTAATGAQFLPTPTGEFRQQGYDAMNRAATASDGPTMALGSTWQHTVESVNATPLVTDDLVVVLSFVGSNSRVYGLETTTGRERWRHDLAGVAVGGMLALDDEYAFTASVVEPRLTAISLSDGTTGWERTVADLPGGFRLGPRVSGDRVYLNDQARTGIHAFDRSSGDRRQVYEGTFTRFAVDADRVYASHGAPGSDPTGLAILSKSDPADRRVVETPGRPGRPTIGDDTAYVGTSNGSVHAVDTEAGETLWTAPVDGWAVSLALTDDFVVASTREKVVAFDRADGTRQWQVDAGTSRTVIAGETLYLGREQGLDVYNLGSSNRRHAYRPGSAGSQVHYVSVVDGGLFAASIAGQVELLQKQQFRL